MIAVHLAILRCAALLVPAPLRAEWLKEWSGELWYVNRGATLFCLGAFRDALWFRRNCHAPRTRRTFLESPARCLLFLAVLAAVSVFYAFRLPGVRDILAQEHFLLAYLFVTAISVVILPATTPFALGEYPDDRHALHGAARLRRWIFLVAKVALLLPIVCCGSLDLSALISRTFQSHGLLVGSVLALRWALVDQRRRCPVCLHVLTNPTRIGGASRTFLEWYGTELICARGHGLLYVPEIPSSCYTTQRWQYLDPSWTSLFS